MALGLSVPSGDVSRGGGADAINPTPRGGEPSGLRGGSAMPDGRSGPHRKTKNKKQTQKVCLSSQKGGKGAI